MKTTRAIGFANEYYTLWDVTSDVSYTGTQGNYRAYETVYYVYIQNLSKDLTKAIEKAKIMGATCLEPNNDLYGRNGSWECQKRLDSKLPNNLSPFFEFGKYTDKLISELTDMDYIKWYYSKTNNRYCKKILLDNGYRELGLDIVTQEEYDAAINYETIQNIIRDNNCIEVVCDKNLRIGEGFAYQRFNFKGIGFDFLFTEFKQMYYQGIEYALPLIGGKAKRIKGKTLKLYYDVIQQGFGVEYIVRNVEILD